MRLSYENWSPDQFERLVVLLCQRLLGLRTIGFAAGPDGGCDAKFEGTTSSPVSTLLWKGITIVQAKHTRKPLASFSDPDFYSPGNAKCVLAQELPRIQKLREADELDHYLLISNRRLSHQAESRLRKVISDTCGIAREDVEILGTDQLDLYLAQYPDIVDIATPDSIDQPFLVSPDELSDVIEALAENKSSVKALLADVPVERTTFERKNELNAATPAFARQLLKSYLKEVSCIQDFLSEPDNTEVLALYDTAAEEFQLKLLEFRGKGYAFDTIYNWLADRLFERSALLRRHKQLTRAVLFYMYWNCDLGESDDVATH